MKKSAGEFDLIKRLVAKLPRDRRVILGPGDDCAILPASRRPTLVTIDSMVEEVHFKTQWSPPQAIGEKALAANLSDIAAMGGYPTICVVNLALRDNADRGFADRLYQGLRAAARRYRVAVVGGNITRADQIAVTIAMLGEVRGIALRRDTARIGDDVFVTGTLGDAAAGYRILSRRLHASLRHARFLTKRFLHPTPRLVAGQQLTALRGSPAAIDLSDGLWQDLGHLLDRSRVGAEIDLSAIPLSASYRAVLNNNPELALSGGEDYELLFCLRPGHHETELSRRLSVPVRRIGRIVAGPRRVLYSGELKRRIELPEFGGWDQLRNPARMVP